LSDRQEISNPRFFKRGERALAKAQRKLAKLNKRTPKRRKQGKVVTKIHERIGNQRKGFCHKQSKKIIDQYRYICMEEKSHFAKSIKGASWNQFRQFLTYKAEEASRKL
jgi:putative transposase